MPALQSSCLSWVEYDHATRTLWVTFHRNGTYALRGVPTYHYWGLLHASSPGGYFAAYLRGRY